MTDIRVAKDGAPGLFSLRPLASPGGEARFAVDLDPSEPHLADHQPGGKPLLATVMGIEILAEGARALRPAGQRLLVTRVAVAAPCILIGDQPHAVEVRLRRLSRGTPGRLGGILLSAAANGAETVHLRAQMLGPPLSMEDLPRQGLRELAGGTARSVPGRAVYELFFHGPGFQVIGSAHWQGQQMVCQLAKPLPASHRHPVARSQLSPRLMELGLQTAGLLEIAYSGRMKIPASIGAIERPTAMEADDPVPLFALAQRRHDGDGAGIDIDIVDVTGRAVLRIRDYRTVPLPFASAAAALARLTAQLRATLKPAAGMVP